MARHRRFKLFPTYAIFYICMHLYAFVRAHAQRLWNAAVTAAGLGASTDTSNQPVVLQYIDVILPSREEENNVCTWQYVRIPHGYSEESLTRCCDTLFSLCYPQPQWHTAYDAPL